MHQPYNNKGFSPLFEVLPIVEISSNEIFYRTVYKQFQIHTLGIIFNKYSQPFKIKVAKLSKKDVRKFLSASFSFNKDNYKFSKLWQICKLHTF
jgi:hypothetical protein